LATSSQVEGAANETLSGQAINGLGRHFGPRLKSLTSLLNNSTVGVALFDQSLHFRVLNSTLARMNGVSVKEYIGKQFHQVFPERAPELETAFRRVWTTGNSLSNLELTARLPAQPESRRWLVNFHPISDQLGQVRLVAATFFEVTRGRCMESNLCRLRDKFRSEVMREPNLLGEEFYETSARTFELVNRSIALLKSSVILRFYASETRLEAGLVRHALFFTANRECESQLFSAQPPSVSDATPSDPLASSGETVTPAVSPSPREREVLRFLADGKSNKEIGSILDISTRTVECYRARIMLKLDLHSTAALVRYAIRNNIVEA
jgi:DNA-binding CsgD family transcriptional regulator